MQSRLVLLPLLGACGLVGADDSESGPCGRNPALDYDNFGRGFLTEYCVGCHSSLLPEGSREGAPLTVNLDTYTDVLAWAERIEVRSVPADASMPPGGGPSEEERGRLGEWLTCQVAADRATLGQP